MGMAAILFGGAERVEKISKPFYEKAPFEILWKLVKPEMSKIWFLNIFPHRAHTNV